MAPVLDCIPRWTGTKIDAYPVTDNILADHFDGQRCAAVVPLARGAYSEDALVVDNMDLESVPSEVEVGI